MATTRDKIDALKAAQEERAKAIKERVPSGDELLETHPGNLRDKFLFPDGSSSPRTKAESDRLIQAAINAVNAADKVAQSKSHPSIDVVDALAAKMNASDRKVFIGKLSPKVLPFYQREARRIRRQDTESGQIIATNRIGGNDYDYRVAKFDNPGLPYRIETRFVRQDGSKGNWESSSMGHYASEANAIEAFLPRFRFGRDDFEAIHPKIIAMQEKAAREQSQIEESRSKKAAQDLIDRRNDDERREIIKENFKSAKFKKASTKIVVSADGSRGPEVTGPSINGLVIHQTRQKMRIQSDTWGITHMGTGLAIGPSFTAQRDAKIAAWRLSQLADFTKGTEQLQASGAQLGVAANRMSIDPLAKIDDLHPALPTPRSPDPKPIKVSEVGLAAQESPKTHGLDVTNVKPLTAEEQKLLESGSKWESSEGERQILGLPTIRMDGSRNYRVHTEGSVFTSLGMTDDEILAERAEPTMEERKVTAPTTRVKDVPSLSFRAAESRFNTKTAGTGRSKRRNPVADAKRQAKVIAPAVPETAEDLALQKKWFANPNQLDFEGIDHPNPRPRSQSGANIRSRRMFRSRRM